MPTDHFSLLLRLLIVTVAVTRDKSTKDAEHNPQGHIGGMKYSGASHSMRPGIWQDYDVYGLNGFSWQVMNLSGDKKSKYTKWSVAYQDAAHYL